MIENILYGIEVRLGEDYLLNKDKWDAIAKKLCIPVRLTLFLIIVWELWNTEMCRKHMHTIEIFKARLL